MLNIKTIAADVSVTTTSQRLQFPVPRATYTLRNKGAGAVYYLRDPASASAADVTTFDGTEAEIKALGGSTIEPGTAVILRNVPDWVHVVCASDTGITATLQVDAGELVADPAGKATATDGEFTVNVTTASGAILAANPARKSALIINYSDTLIWLSLGGTAVASQGIPLAPRVDANNPGGSYEITAANLFTGAINGIHGGSGNKVVVGVEV